MTSHESILLIPVVAFAMLVPSASAQTPVAATELNGTWTSPGGSLVSLTQEGTAVRGRVLAPTAQMAAEWGWTSGDTLLEGVRNGADFVGSAYIHFAVTAKKTCPRVGPTKSDLELQLVDSTKLMGRFRNRILRADCTLVDGDWGPVVFTRQQFVLSETAKEIAIVVMDGILFDLDRAELKPSALAVLKNLKALVIDQQRYTHVTIEGHTDDQGSNQHNEDLSARRANAVARWLAGAGVDNGVLRAEGLGETHPVVPNTSAINRAKNRRVEIRLEK